MEQSGCWWLRPAACLPRWSKSNVPWWSSVGNILPPLVCILPSRLLPYRLIECILVFLLQFLRQDWGGQTERLHAYRSGDVETWFHNTKLFCFLFVLTPLSTCFVFFNSSGSVEMQSVDIWDLWDNLSNRQSQFPVSLVCCSVLMNILGMYFWKCPVLLVLFSLSQYVRCWRPAGRTSEMDPVFQR